MTDGNARSELMVLQAVRLAGVADVDVIQDRAFLADEERDRVLSGARHGGLVEPFSFGESSGWILTEAGHARLATLLSDEAITADATHVLATSLEAFEPLNERFVALVSRWQLRTTSATSTAFGGADATEVQDLLASLSSIGDELRPTLSELIGVLPRFGRYPVQYTAAVDRARQDGLRWITGVGLLSCHVVWAELHQDLLSTLGRDRLAHDGKG